MTPSEHVGSRIRLYRTQRHLTLETFSKMISRSPSTVSKYESGKIVVDIETLFEISASLNISINQLVDYTKPDTSVPSQNIQDNFFKQANLYYMYSFFGVDKQFYVCALEIVRNQKDTEDKIILYYDISDTKNYSNSNYLYTGYINYFDFHVTMKMENPYNKGDQLFIYAKTPFNTNGTSKGLVLGLSESLRSPCSFKVIFSKTALKEDSELKKGLSLSTKDVLAEIRRTNNLMGY